MHADSRRARHEFLRRPPGPNTISSMLFFVEHLHLVVLRDLHPVDQYRGLFRHFRRAAARAGQAVGGLGLPLRFRISIGDFVAARQDRLQYPDGRVHGRA